MNNMETIVRKAIEGGYNGYPKPFCIECGNYEAPSENTKSCNMFLDPLFWQSLGKECGWEYFTVVETPHLSFAGGNIWGWKAIALRFHEINLTQSFDEAISYLTSLIHE